MIDIDNIVRGICKINHNIDLYNEEIEEFCKLMCKSSFAYKVSKRFNEIYSNNYIFNPDTEEDQAINPNDNTDIHSVHHIRLIDDKTYIVIQDYIHTISIPIDINIAKKIVEKGIGELSKEYKV